MSRFPKLRRVVVTLVGIFAVLVVSNIAVPERLQNDWPISEIAIALVLLGAAGFALSAPAGAYRARTTKDVRDAIVGWGIVATFVGALICLLLPLPWGPAAIAGVVAVGGFATSIAHRHAEAIRLRLFPPTPPTA